MEIQTVGVAGLGLLGRGIAACFLAHGFRVIGFTIPETAHEEARNHIATALEELIVRAGFPSSLRENWRNRYTEVSTVTTFGDCDFVIESIIEDLDAKEILFNQLEAIIRADVPVASNTSSIPITQLQARRKHPERFLGMHWIEPAYNTRFLELIRGEMTSPATFEAAETLARHIGKDPSLVQKDVPAFIVNRLAYAVYREALYTLELGVADIETIDRSFRNAFGLFAAICGPFRWIDLTGGPALYGRILKGLLPSLSDATELPQTIKTLMEEDARGIVNGRGFYNYTEEEAMAWEQLLHEHAWKVRALMDEYFPLKDEATAKLT